MEKTESKQDKGKDSRSILELTNYIQSLKGKERQDYCRTLSPEQRKAYIRCLRDKESEKVKGIYRCMVPLGGSTKFSVRLHEGEVQTFTMKDGEEYEIPLSVAKHLRENCWFPEHGYILDAQGKPSVGVGKKHNTHNFEPSAFF